MAIGDICNRTVVVANREQTIREAAAVMRQEHVGDLVVVEGHGRNTPVGILTDRDIVIGVVAQGLDTGVLTVGDVMGSNLVTAREDQGVFETIKLMRAKGIRRLPIVDARGGLVGVVTVDDVLELLAEELGTLAKAVAGEQAIEARTRK